MKQHKRPLLKALSAAAAGLVTAPPAGAAEEWNQMDSPLSRWSQSADGDFTANGNRAPLDLNGPDDILDNLETAFSVNSGDSSGDLSFFAEYLHTVLNPESLAESGEVRVSADVDVEKTRIEFGASRALSESERNGPVAGMAFYC